MQTVFFFAKCEKYMNLKKICLQNEEKADIVGKGKYKQNGFGMQKRE